MLIKDESMNGSTIGGGIERHQFRYSNVKFQLNIAIALCLTCMLCALTWMVMGIWGIYNRDLYTFITGLVFFGFVSAKAIRNYFQKEIILAIQLTGILDKRWSADLVTWESVKEITIRQREEEVALNVWLWPHGSSKVQSMTQTNNKPDFTIELDVLDADPTSIVNLVAKYHAVKPALD